MPFLIGLGIGAVGALWVSKEAADVGKIALAGGALFIGAKYFKVI